MQEIFVKYYICQLNGGSNLTLSYFTQKYKPQGWLIRFENFPCNMQVGCSNPSRKQTKIVKTGSDKRSATDLNVTGRGQHKTDIQCHIRCGKLRTAQCPSAPIIGINLQQK